MGWYGNDNAGDEAILSGIVRLLCDVAYDPMFTVFSDDPDDTVRRHEVSATPSLPTLASDWSATNALWRLRRCVIPGVHTLREADLCLVGGGGIVADHNESTLLRWLRRIRIARRLAPHVACFGVGVEPLTRKSSAGLIRRALKEVELIACRDSESLGVLEGCGLGENLLLGADPALALDSSPGGLSDDLMALARDAIIYIPVHRFEGQRRSRYARVLGESAAIFRATTNTLSGALVLGAMFPADEQLAAEIAAAANEEIHLLRLYQHTPAQIAALLGLARVTVSSRLHGLILGWNGRARLVPVVYDIKVESFARMADLGDPILEFGDGVVWRNQECGSDELAEAMRTAVLKPGGRVEKSAEFNARLKRQSSAAIGLLGAK